jgi:hypothetical protein
MSEKDTRPAPDGKPTEKAQALPQSKDDPGYDGTVSDAGSKTLRGGTHVLPMPDDAPTVAGMPRKNRVHTEPGNPGAIAPETQVDDGRPPKKSR